MQFVDEFIIKHHPLKSNFFPAGGGFFTEVAPKAVPLFCKLILTRFQYGVISIVSFVNYVNFTRVAVLEHKEIVVKHIHLQDGFLFIHGAKSELLALYYFVAALFLYRLALLNVKSVGFESFFNFSFVLSYLADYFINAGVESVVLVFGSLLRAGD